jgi:hypothetical protein
VDYHDRGDLDTPDQVRVDELEVGRLVLANIVLVGALISLGAFNQRRMLPELRAVSAGAGPSPVD